MDQGLMLEIVEGYVVRGSHEHGEIKIIQLPDRKTVFIEQSGDAGRSIMLTEYKVDGKTCWAGYSSRSHTVYLSLVN